jgi:hypothetical protein
MPLGLFLLLKKTTNLLFFFVFVAKAEITELKGPDSVTVT